MADADGFFDDLDAFFSAAEQADGDALEQAAQNVTDNTARSAKPGARPSADTARRAGTTLVKQRGVRPAPAVEDGEVSADAQEEDLGALAGKFIAVEPESVPGADTAPETPFLVLPAHIHTFLPWWGWMTIGLVLAGLIAGVLLMPVVNLNRLTARLDDQNSGNVQSVMRQLVVKGDERTVGKLFDVANSRDSGLAVRLRAVDTLGLIQTPDADRALLRLELAGNTDAQVREAAIAARKQREAAKTRERTR